MRCEMLEEDADYSAKQLDKEVITPSQIRKIAWAFMDELPEIFPWRREMPKTLVFVKTKKTPGGSRVLGKSGNLLFTT